MSSEHGRYVFNCKLCLHGQKVGQEICRRCEQLTSGGFYADSPVGPHRVCADCCGGDMEWTPLPERCECGSAVLEWFDADRGQWYSPDLAPRPTVDTPVWIAGDIDVDLAGGEILRTLPGGELSGPNRLREYHVDILGGVLRNPVHVAGPPAALGPEELRPLRQNLVSSILVEQASDKRFVNCALRDLRIHHWVLDGIKPKTDSDANGTTSLLARVRGRGFGYIVLPEPPELEPIPISVPVPDSAAEKGSARSEVNAPEEGLPEQVPAFSGLIDRSCASCSLFLRLLLSGLIWWICDFRLAVLGFVIMGVTCLQDEIATRFRAARSAPVAAGGALILLSISGLIWYFWALNHGDCRQAPWWPLVLPALALLLSPWFVGCMLRMWLLILFQVALWSWCGAAMIGCHVWSGIAAFGVSPPVPGVLVGSPGGSTAGSGIVLGQGGSSVAGGDISPVGPGMGVGGSAPLPPPTDAGTPLSVPAVTAPINENQTPDSSPANPGLLSRLNEAIGQRITGQIPTGIIAGGVVGTGLGGRIGIADAIDNPELFESCQHAIYFPNESVFDLNRAELRDAVRPQLRQLAFLLRKYPNDRFIVTGHADRSGDATPDGVLYNLRLSERRASAVSDWLAEQLGVGPERFEIQGAGTRLPLTNVAEMEAYNRRIEVRMQCRDAQVVKEKR